MLVAVFLTKITIDAIKIIKCTQIWVLHLQAGFYNMDKKEYTIKLKNVSKLLKYVYTKDVKYKENKKNK